MQFLQTMEHFFTAVLKLQMDQHTNNMKMMIGQNKSLFTSLDTVFALPKSAPKYKLDRLCVSDQPLTVSAHPGLHLYARPFKISCLPIHVWLQTLQASAISPSKTSLTSKTNAMCNQEGTSFPTLLWTLNTLGSTCWIFK